MSKYLEIAALGTLVLMSAAFVGALRPAVEPGLSPVFWGCAAAVLAVIIFRKRRRGGAAGAGS